MRPVLPGPPDVTGRSRAELLARRRAALPGLTLLSAAVVVLGGLQRVGATMFRRDRRMRRRRRDAERAREEQQARWRRQWRP